MKIRILKSKIHRAKVTEARPDYEGSITIDATLLDAAGILPYEEVHVWDVTNGQRLTTYALAGEPGGGQVAMNGAAALLIKQGDVIIIASYAEVDEKELASGWKPRTVAVDRQNRIVV